MPRWFDPVPALKQRVADEIIALVAGWTQEYAADFLGTSQPKVSEIRRGHLDRFSLDRLVRYLSRLHRDIALVTTKRAGLTVHNHRDLDVRRAARAEAAAAEAAPASGADLRDPLP